MRLTSDVIRIWVYCKHINCMSHLRVNGTQMSFVNLLTFIQRKGSLTQSIFQIGHYFHTQTEQNKTKIMFLRNILEIKVHFSHTCVTNTLTSDDVHFVNIKSVTEL